MRGEFYREASVGEKSARRSGWSARDRACWRKRKPTAPVRNTKPPTRRATQIGKKGAVGGVCVTTTGVDAFNGEVQAKLHRYTTGAAKTPARTKEEF